MDRIGIQFEQGAIETFCKENRIVFLALFGSVLSDDFRPESDVDVLVRFEEGHTPGLLGMADLELRLTRIIGRKVDLRTPAELSRYFRDEVLASCAVQYAA